MLDRAARLAATAVYQTNDGGLLRPLGVPYDPDNPSSPFGNSGLAAALTYSKENRAYLFAYRGTELQDPRDIGTDIGIGFGFHTDQARLAIELASQVAAKLKGERVILTGHSLGATLAAIASYSTGLEAICFNPASVDIRYRSGVADSRIRSHVTFLDFLSVGRTISNGIPNPDIPNPNLRFAPGEIIMHPPRLKNLNPLQFHSMDQYPD